MRHNYLSANSTDSPFSTLFQSWASKQACLLNNTAGAVRPLTSASYPSTASFSVAVPPLKEFNAVTSFAASMIP